MFHRSPRIWRGIAIVAILFIIANGAIYVLFMSKTYPNTRVGNHHVGSVSFAQLPDTLTAAKLVPSKLTFTYNQHSANVNAKDIGLAVDTTSATEHARKRQWLPVLNFVTKHSIPIEATINQQKLTTVVTAINEQYHTHPADAHIAVENGTFATIKEVTGNTVQTTHLKQAVLQQVRQGKKKIALPTQHKQPEVKTADLQKDLEALKNQQAVPIVFTYGPKTSKATPEVIATWYVKDANTYKLSDAAVRSYVVGLGKQWGITVSNAAEAAKAVQAALAAQKSLAYAITAAAEPSIATAAAAKKTVTYCVGVDGVDPSFLPEFERKLAAVYSDSRGWGLGGKISFVKVASGCNMKVWLASASQVPTYGAICDNIWSCAVKPHVIINFDRWRYASDAWNQAAGSLDNYRSMVINHETGHWLGFGHKYCGGAGQPAPVMQQQSISLQGCTFSPWPSAAERSQLAQTYSL